MELYWLDYLWTILFFAAAGWVAGYFLLHPRRIVEFPAFFAYALWQLVSAAAWWGLRWGGVERASLYSFNQVVQVLTLASVTALLIQIYFLLKRRADWSHWIGLAVFAGCLWPLAQGRFQDFYFAFITVFVLFNCALALMVQVLRLRSRKVDLGRSYTRILFGLSLMLAFQTVLYVYSLLEMTPWFVLVYLGQPVSIAGWLWYVAALRRVELPVKVSEAAEVEGMELAMVRSAERMVAK